MPLLVGFVVALVVGFVVALVVAFAVGFAVGALVMGALVGGGILTLRHVPPTSVPKGSGSATHACVGHLAVVSVYCDALQTVGAVFFVLSSQPAAELYQLATCHVPGTSGKGGLPVVELMSPV